MVIPLILSAVACNDDSPLPTEPSPTKDATLLPVFFLPQVNADWSWAAASSMAMVFHSGGNIPQCMLATIRAAQTAVDCCGLPSDVCYGVPSVSEIIDVINAGVTAGDLGAATGGTEGDYDSSALVYGFTAVSTGPLAQGELEEYINNRRPIVMRLDGLAQPHHAVIYGYDLDGDLFIHDPQFGSFTVPYTQTFDYAGTALTWTDTIIVSRQTL